MRNFKLVLIITIFLSSISHAASLKWDAVVAPEGLKPVLGYIIYFSKTGDSTLYNFNVGNVTQFDLSGNALNLEFGIEYTFYVTVYNADGHSDPSNTVIWVKPPNIPKNYIPDMVINVPGSSVLNITIKNE